jgi:DNA-binding GntR family transcriptional regulator
MSERRHSPALLSLPATALRIAPLAGVEARMYGRLRHSILEAKIKPGTRLREEAIGEVFSVSRTITRKILQVLEQEGAVYLPPHRGAYVATPTTEDTAGAIEALGVALTHVVNRLADPATVLQPNQRALIEQHIQAQSAAEANGDRLTAQLLAFEFLVLLAAIHGNPIITDLIDRMQLRLALGLMVHHRYPMPLEHTGFQRRLRDAILNHQPDQATAILHELSKSIKQDLPANEASETVDLAAMLRQE